MAAWTQLLVYGFGPGAKFEGQFVGVIERVESGMALRVLDALFVQKDEAGEVSATTLKGDGAGSIGARMIEFRLDDAARRRATERALGDDSDLAQQLSETIAPGAAIVAILVEHRWGEALDEAAGRIGGKPIAGGFVEAGALSDLAADLLAAARELR